MVSILKGRQKKIKSMPLLTARKKWFYILGAWIVFSLLLILVGQIKFSLSQERILRYKIGDIVEEDFYLERSISFFDEEATNKIITFNRRLTPPVYVLYPEISDSVMNRFDRFTSYFLGPLAAQGTNPENRLTVNNYFPSVDKIVDLLADRPVREIDKILTLTQEVLQSLQHEGIFLLNADDGGVASGVIEIVRSNDQLGKRRTLVRHAVPTPDNLAPQIHSLISMEGLESNQGALIEALVNYFTAFNGYFNEGLSQKNRDLAESTVEEIHVSLDAGSKLLTAGSVLNIEQAHVLEILRNQRYQSYQGGFLYPLFYMTIIFALGLVVVRTFSITLDTPKIFWLYFILAGLYLLITSLLISFVRFDGFLNVSVILPTALFTLLLSQLFQDHRLGVLSSLLMAFLTYFLSHGDGHLFLIALASGIAGTLVIRGKETRIGMLGAGLRLSLFMSSFTLISGVLFFPLPFKTALVLALVAAINGLVTGVFSIAFLPIFEHLLNTATTFRLIELSDQNIPIFKRMRLQAPGTYIHSQNVAQLAETACDAIGANGLLARVGAYYHDIGKIDQPHYFVENQNGENRHDELKTSLSIAVIKSHVKIGMEKGRELRLPDEVLAVIEQHHGTSLIQYFYDRAMKEKKKDETIDPENYSYPGPKPHGRETAIVMLADLSEAASRVLKKPNIAKLEKYVWDLIMERFRSGELNESGLTLRDLETVKQSFAQVLIGHFHMRIDYPKTEIDS